MLADLLIGHDDPLHFLQPLSVASYQRTLSAKRTMPGLQDLNFEDFLHTNMLDGDIDCMIDSDLVELENQAHE